MKLKRLLNSTGAINYFLVFNFFAVFALLVLFVLKNYLWFAIALAALIALDVYIISKSLKYKKAAKNAPVYVQPQAPVKNGVKCKKCKMKIPRDAIICPYCQSKRGYSVGDLIGGGIVVIILLMAFLSLIK